MKVKLPKELKGVKFPKVLSIDMNNFDIGIFLPTLFHTILAGGRSRVKRTNDPADIQKYVDALARNPVLQHFDDPIGRKVLERLVRTTLITTGGVGRSNQGEQITSIVPYTLLAYKPGFPIESSRHRGVNTFTYQALLESMNGNLRKLQEKITLIFGKGVSINNSGLDGTYDGKAQLDTITRLSIAFLDGFTNTPMSVIREPEVAAACPELAHELADDLLTFLSKFHERMPSQALTYNLLALINFELFTYTLKLVYAINALVRDPTQLPPAMREPLAASPPQIYLDFTQNARGRSHEMAKECVRRDIEAFPQFLSSNLLLRLLDNYAVLLGRNAQRKATIDAILAGKVSGPLYLQGLLLLRDEPLLAARFEAQAQLDEERIREENKLPEDTTAGSTNEDDLNWLDDITDTAESDIERVVNLLAEGQRDSALTHYISWYRSVGGMKEPHGLLAGTVKSRPSWRYAPSNDLLAVLVQVAAARISKDGVESIRLQDFLQFLEQHYGILIDRPPALFKGTEYIAAAHENLRAMQNRLRQMGIFRDLSDDFTIQRLHPPYAENTANTTEATRA